MEQAILEFVRKWDEELMSARERVYAQDVPDMEEDLWPEEQVRLE
jgi:hypothetical protein